MVSHGSDHILHVGRYLGAILLIGTHLVGGQITLTCPDDIATTAPLWESHAEVTWSEPTFQPPDARLVLTYQSHTSGQPIAIGKHTVSHEYASRSDEGLTVDCSFGIEVAPGDTELPVVSNCPSDFEEEYEPGTGNAAVTWREPTATDNSGSVRVEKSNEPGADIYLGHGGGRINEEITYKFKDPSGNIAYCVFTITFTAVDTSAPEVTYCPDPATVYLPLAFTESAGGLELPHVRENSNKLYWSTEPDGDLPYVFPLGTTTASHRFSNGNGQTATCDVSVTVAQRDFTPPEVYSCPTSITVGFPPESPPTLMKTVSWSDPEASDNSGTVFLQSQSHTPGSLYPVASSFVVEYRFSDPSGNEAYCSFLVQFKEDGENPSIHGCPEDTTWVSGSKIPTRGIWSEPFALDETTVGLVFQTHYPDRAEGLSVGNTTVEYIFEDSAGNTASCTFVVRVLSGNDENPSSGAGQDGAGATVTFLAIVCAAIVIISIISIVGVTVCCIKWGAAPETPSTTPTGNAVGQPTLNYDSSVGYLKAVLHRPSPAPTTGESTHQYHEYMEMSPQSSTEPPYYVQPDGGNSRPVPQPQPRMTESADGEKGAE